MVRPKKHLGQHFLHDENIARKIISFIPDIPRLILEIGPGTGILSKYLLADPGHDTYFMEIDREASSFLLEKYPDIKDRLIIGDFLDQDFEQFNGPMALVGNFPYNISSQIIFKALEHRDKIASVVGMFQKEVAERIIHGPGGKTYGILSVLTQAFYETEYLFTVGESVFIPPPKVKSAVIRLTRNSRIHLDCDEDLFFRLVKTAFNQRRKTLRNALKPLTEGLPGAGKLPFPDKRAEQLTVEDFIHLAAILQQIIV
jgi:16S rRNA (adenine1518-N6/adenine1519-N6)-dimethyltransferase